MTLLSSFELQKCTCCWLALTKLFAHDHTKVIALEAILTGHRIIESHHSQVCMSLRDQDKFSECR